MHYAQILTPLFFDVEQALHNAHFNQAIWMTKRLLARDIRVFGEREIESLNTPSVRIRYTAQHLDILYQHHLVGAVHPLSVQRALYSFAAHIEEAIFHAESLWALKLLAADVCLLPLDHDEVAQKINSCVTVSEDELYLLQFTERHIQQLVAWNLLVICGHEDALHLSKSAQTLMTTPKQLTLYYEDDTLNARDNVHRLFL